MVKAFSVHKGLVVPMERANVDTDQIIPKQYLKSIQRTGFGLNLFDDWRYLDPGEPGMDHTTRRLNPDFILNQTRYQGASILLAGKNFGCGSSREHAPWALDEYGIRCIIAPSFADIFYSNCIKNGLLAIDLNIENIEYLFSEVARSEGYSLEIDLPAQQIRQPDGQVIDFEVEPFLKERLVRGLDDIGLTLESADEIGQFEAARLAAAPWLASGR